MSGLRPAASIRILVLFWALFFLWLAAPAQQVRAEDEYALLVKGVLAYYAEVGASDLPEDSSLGQDGLLFMTPEVAKFLGLEVYVNDQYLESRKDFAKAEEFLEQATDAMKTTAREKSEGEHVAEVAHFACLYQRTMAAAVESMRKYRAALHTEKDERFDEEKCSALLRRLLKEGLVQNKMNLRDALGHVYNRCQGIEPVDGYSLTSENIRFVNYVYNFFLTNASQEDLEKFDTDSVDDYAGSAKLDLLKRSVGRTERRYLLFLEPVLEDFVQNKYAVRPSLFLALMRQESRFNPRSVSQVGAAGITQIMPGTGLLLGMTSIFAPPYFKKAREMMVKERRMKARALRLIQKPEQYCIEADAKKAREMMQKALLYKKKRVELYKRYKQELISDGTDERLDPRKAIEAGYRLFSQLMKEQRGDISRALAAYNAGSRAVKRYKGLPPYPETVTYRNRILRYYREYLSRTEGTAKTAPSDD